MRKILPFFGVLLILVCCAVPAFASTDGIGTYYYMPIEFDTASSTGIGRFEWIYNYVQLPTEHTVYFSLGGEKGYGGTIRDGKFYGQVAANKVGGMTGYFFLPSSSILLHSADKLVRPYSLDGCTISFYDEDNGYISSVYISVSVYTAIPHNGGATLLNTQTLSQTFSVNAPTASLGAYIHDVLKQSRAYNSNLMYIASLTVTINGRVEVAQDVYEWRYVVPWDNFDTSRPKMAQWIKQETLTNVDNSLAGHFDVGTFLGDSVSAFMNASIWGEFTFGHLLGISLTLGILFFALKLLV